MPLESVLDGLDPRIRAILDRAPLDERALFELSVEWPGLEGPAAEVASITRVFLTTCDILRDAFGQVAECRATASAFDPGDVEVVLYLPIDDLLDHAVAAGHHMVECLAELVGEAIASAASQHRLVLSGRYARAVAGSRARPLLADEEAPPLPGESRLVPVSDAWEPMGLAAIQDLAQADYGPTNFDRSEVVLPRSQPPQNGCAACAGTRFGFPAELIAAQEEFCSPHHEAASAIVQRRIHGAVRHNPDGWEAITAASALVGTPFARVPWPLRAQLADILHDWRGLGRAGEHAALAEELLGCLPDRDSYETFARGSGFDISLHEWFVRIINALASSEPERAERIARRWCELDEFDHLLALSIVAEALALNGHHRHARALADEVLSDPASGALAVLDAGKALEVLGDLGRAEEIYWRVWDEATDSYVRHDAAYLLSELLHDIPGRQEEADDWVQRGKDLVTAERADARAPRRSPQPKIGRNEPCHCGSGKKFKRCCGA